ncbi:MAG: hypothetical protein JWQ07_4633 [Ramlibacter sp.]|nr:hypothetical protein [Ramlibacter sp.]
MSSIQVRLVRLLDYLDVELTGQADLSEVLDAIRKLGNVTRDQGDKRLLLDLLGVEGELHVAGQMQVGEQIVQSLSHLQSMASVVPADKITRVSEHLARAHGLRMKVFDAKDAAIAWLRDTEPPPEIDNTLMEAAHAAIWDAVRHLFPRHAQAIQLPNGSLAISWSVAHQAGAHYDMATPITVRLEPDLIDSLTLADPEQRKRIATHQEAAFRAGLMGYDPYAAVPSARVIILG